MIFKYKDREFHAMLREGETWFDATDTCAILALGNPYSSLSLLDEDERVRILYGTLGGKQEVVFITEPGLYSLILRSRKPEAKEFKRWVTHEVLPALRKTGGIRDRPGERHRRDHRILLFSSQHPNTNPMFNFEGHDVRVVMRDGQPWFIALDVCRALDVYIRIRDGKTELHDSFKRKLDSDEVTPAIVGGRAVSTISESGLYKLVMKARPNVNPRIHRFQNWVTREVLPALRKDGMYVMGEEKVKTGR